MWFLPTCRADRAGGRPASAAPKASVSGAVGLLALTLVACAARPPVEGSTCQAIFEGTPDTGDVGVALLVTRYYHCSATLITPRILITAAHCLDTAVEHEGQAFFDPEPDWRHQPAVPVLHARRYPGISEVSGGHLAHDIAVVLLAEDAPADAHTWPLLPAEKAAGYPDLRAGSWATASTAPEPLERSTKERSGWWRPPSGTSTSIPIRPDTAKATRGDRSSRPRARIIRLKSHSRRR